MRLAALRAQFDAKKAAVLIIPSVLDTLAQSGIAQNGIAAPIRVLLRVVRVPEIPDTAAAQPSAPRSGP